MANFRIGGLASGLDTESLINDLMRVQRVPIDKLSQKKQTLEWQRDSYRDINLKLASFRDMTLNMRLQSSFLSKVTTSSNSNKVTATADSTAGSGSYTLSAVSRLATSATNASTAGISANGQKVDTTKSIYSQISQFVGLDEEEIFKDTADGMNEEILVKKAGKEFSLQKLGKHSLEKMGSVTVGADNYQVVTSLDDLDANQKQVFVDEKTGKMTFSQQIPADSKIGVEYEMVQKDTISVGSSTKEVQLSQIGITEFEESITFTWDKKDTDGNVIKDENGDPIKETKTFTAGTDVNNLAENQFYLDKETGKITFGSDLQAGAKAEVSYDHQYFEFNMSTYNETGEVNQTFTFDARDSLTTVIDKVNKSSLGVNMFYDQHSDKVTIARTSTGDFNQSGDGKEISFNGSPFLTNVLKLDSNNEKGGENAKFTLNGLETERTSNTFTVNGVSFTLKDTFDAVNGDSPVTISINNDTDKAIENIKEFVEKYNELIDNIQGQLSEEKYRDYAPLTKDQRAALSEKDIELWEEKAKSGLLRSDQQLSSLLSNMRMNFYTPLEGATSEYNQLSAIGITTTKNYLEGGKLEINEDKLKEALENDAEGVFNLFAADGDTLGEQGISRRLRDTVTQSIDAITLKAGNGMKTNSQFSIGKNLDDINKRITELESKLADKEQRYWSQFAAMETQMQKMNEQMNYMLTQFGYSSQ
ncbi:flagellar filament capping protein FliD [Cytobacillus sp. Sa5YUA1]|uniref:Flagellar hook-associated protein 2 n=1 Tax=Cytobacillus stercorigallinarum TaxID=2762240 RepID=A0ABR8QNI5_9BACI|nr:flagellar filament capping protein FliD [Cytobacillus stercorigallinarum]MBD7937099.1 flagellar filament capping protein FliD [Cytobacillus stercorigallinarum]